MLWVKSLHIIFVITWMAAIFYLPRLFVYHTQALAEGDARGDARFKIMERKLFWGIMTPGAIFSIVFGLWLWFGYGISGKWLMWKLVAVLFLMAFHAWCFVQMRAFAAGRNTLTERTFRILNELPVFALFAIVILVVVKPF
ncbi:MAG TPA: CopD family protein [Casimicrobium sp.]|jgi:putative membrane protein|nr:CopD family protein [Casimicrobium sp.]HPT55239.1 CopD family protein [Casimicrobium sp.]HPV22594.1 CopD family protein [Casimicrobium sp.]